MRIGQSNHKRALIWLALPASALSCFSAFLSHSVYKTVYRINKQNKTSAMQDFSCVFVRALFPFTFNKYWFTLSIQKVGRAPRLFKPFMILTNVLLIHSQSTYRFMVNYIRVFSNFQCKISMVFTNCNFKMFCILCRMLFFHTFMHNFFQIKLLYFKEILLCLILWR